MWSSAGASVSLIAAAVILVVGISAAIAVRGFSSVAAEPQAQAVAMASPAADDRDAAEPRPARVVLAEPRPRAARRPAARHAARAARRSAPTRGVAAGRRAPALMTPPARSHSAASGDGRGAGHAHGKGPIAPPAPVPGERPVDSVDAVVEDLGQTVERLEPVERVGDLLLDVRDLLP